MKKLILSSFALLLLVGCSTITDVNNKEDEGPKVINLECEEGTTKHTVEGTPIQLCYNTAWGEPVLETPTSTTGTITKLSFASEASSPTVWYQSTDYTSGGETDFCFDCLIMSADVDTLTTQFASGWNIAAEDINLRKTYISEERAVRVHANYLHPLEEGTATDSLIFYVPNAWEGYHLQVVGPNSMAQELDEFAEWHLKF